MQGLSLKNSVEIKKDGDLIQDRLERLFFIGYDEIPGFMNNGSKIMDYFYEPADQKTVNNILFEVKRLLTLYEPDIILEYVEAGFVPLQTEEIMLVIGLQFHLAYDPNESKNVQLSKVRDMKRG